MTRRHTAAAGGEAEVDIQTGEAHRRRGCALALCKAFIARCLEEGLLPKWDCQLGNGASNRLAEKLGSVPVGKYPLLYIK